MREIAQLISLMQEFITTRGATELCIKDKKGKTLLKDSMVVKIKGRAAI